MVPGGLKPPSSSLGVSVPQEQVGESAEPPAEVLSLFQNGVRRVVEECGVGWGGIPQYPVRDKAKSRGRKGAGLGGA